LTSAIPKFAKYRPFSSGPRANSSPVSPSRWTLVAATASLPSSDVSLQPSCCHGLAATVSQPPSFIAATVSYCCHRLAATVSLPLSRCYCLAATVSLPPSRCHRLSLPPPRCHRLAATTSLPPPRYHCCAHCSLARTAWSFSLRGRAILSRTVSVFFNTFFLCVLLSR
jgi:hypothetical protein